MQRLFALSFYLYDCIIQTIISNVCVIMPNGYMFISKDYDPKFNITFSINNDDHNEDTIFIRVRTSPFFKSLIEYYRISRLYFENQSIKNNCMKYLLKYLQ